MGRAMTFTTIPPSTAIVIGDPVEKIGKLIRLMASTIDGEALGAVRALGNALEGAGADFHYLADLVRANWQDPEEVVIQLCPRPKWQRLADELLKFPDILLDKEFAFLANMSRSPFEPTPRQWKWLGDIEARLRPHKAAR
jgi:hypothetical protein